MTAFDVIIPARYGSTRLPGKPLLKLGDKSILQHVYEQACQSQAQRVIIATDDERIQSAAEAFSAPVVMTATSHVSGTDRLQEVAQQLALQSDSIVVNVQGDEPFIPSAVIDQVADNLAKETAADMATLCETITDTTALVNPNVVKVVFDQQGMALYFSRASIPWDREQFPLSATAANLSGADCWCRHIGIYAYRVGLLHDFVSWGTCALEQTESLEQLRALWHGRKIHVAIAAEAPPPGIDTQADLEQARRFLAERSN